VQTTLTGAAIIIILALVTALVGPLFVDWGTYRGEFEARVGQLTGLEVRVSGPIDVRLLPTPTLTLQQIEIGRSDNPARTRAQALRVELALGSLLHGEWRAPVVKLQGPELAIAIDRSGRLDWSAPSIGLDHDSVSIERLEVENGRAIVADAASNSELSLDNVSFVGQVRSLDGPAKGEGSFTFDGRPFPYRLSISRVGDDGAAKVRLNLVPPDRRQSSGAEALDHQRSIDVDGSVLLDHGVPRFEGTLQWVRRQNDKSTTEGASEPWRLIGHLRLDSTAADFDQIELQYGPDERALRLRGDARLGFGAKPLLTGNLIASQIDLDRILAEPEATGRRPLLALRKLAESLAQAQQLPAAVNLKMNIETVTLAGAMLQRVDGELSSNGKAWDIGFTLRAPGLTQVEVRGRLDQAPAGVSFGGSTQIDSADPRALLAWLTARQAQLAMAGPLRFSSKISLGSEKVAFEQLQATIDRMKIEGGLDYSWPAGNEPAKLNATLRAPELDIDRAQQLLTASLGDLPLEWPRQGILAIDVGRAVGSGLEAKDVSIKVRRDPGGFEIEHLTAGDIGGAKLALGGRVDTRGETPRGSLRLDLEARNLDGMAAVIEKFSPVFADRMRHAAPRSAPVRLTSSVALDRSPAGASEGPSLTMVKLAGTAGVFRVDLQGEAIGAPVDLTDLEKLGRGKVHLGGSLNSTDGSALIDLFGLDRLVSVSQRSGRFTFDIKGALDGEMAVNAGVVVPGTGGLDVSANGTVQLLGKGAPAARLAVRATAANVNAFRPTPGRRIGPLPLTTFTGRVLLADNAVTLADLSGTAAGVPVKGQLGLNFAGPPQMTGELKVATTDLPAAIGTAVGYPRRAAAVEATWPSDQFEPPVIASLSGRIGVNVGQVALTSRLSARDVRAVVEFDPSSVAIANIDGSLAGGRVAGSLRFERTDEGMTAQSHLRFADSDAVDLLGAGSPLSGKLTLDLDLLGAGRSPLALVGSLRGGGKISWRDGSIARLDPAAFDAMARLAEQDLAIDPTRIRDRMDAALAVGRLPVPLAESLIEVDVGQLSLIDPEVHAAGADLALAGSVDLLQSAIDAKMKLSGAKAAGAAVGTDPEISISLKGSIDAPKRTLDVAALTNWLWRRAAEQKERHADALEQAVRERSINAGEGNASPPPASGPEGQAAARDGRPGPAAAPPQRQRPTSSQTVPPIAGQDGKSDEPRFRLPSLPSLPSLLPPPLNLSPPSAPPHGPRG
jgi:large subunit ribosomal protein L24